MKYLIKRATITKGITQTGSHKGETYHLFMAELYIEDNIFANPAQLPRFYTLSPAIAAAFLQYANVDPQDANTFNVDTTKLPDTLKYIVNCFPYKRTLTRDYGRIDKTTKEFIKAANGSTTPIRSILIYSTKVADNETGEMNWVEDVDAIINRILERGYKPLNDTPLTEAAPQQAAAPQAAVDDAAAKIAELKEQLAKAEAGSATT